MHLLFLVPLTTGLISGYFFKNAVDEMAYLMGVITIVSLFLSLVLAPWQLQLLLLMLVIISTRKLLLLNQSQTELADQVQPSSGSNFSNQPTLTSPTLTSKYRGVSYQPNTTPNPTTVEAERELTGKYRGAAWKIRNVSQASKLPENSKLRYRGARPVNQTAGTMENKD